jgi:DNA mismatch repair ATPase MutS
MKINHYHHIVQTAEAERFQTQVLGKLDLILAKLEGLITPEMQEKIDAAYAKIQANREKLSNIGDDDNANSR